MIMYQTFRPAIRQALSAKKAYTCESFGIVLEMDMSDLLVLGHG